MHINIYEGFVLSVNVEFCGCSTSRRVSHTETVTSMETRMSRTILTAQREQPAYIPTSEQHATTIITDVKPQVPQITAQEHFATTITTDLQPKYQPVDLTIAVPVPPKFAQALKNIQAMEGSKVTFDGVVKGEVLNGASLI